MMKIEIWSDVMCPFCYIGKRNIEKALQSFDAKNKIEIEWKSFQLDPSIPQSFEKKIDAITYLAERKGISYEQSKEMHLNVVSSGEKVGLKFDFENAIVANSFNAHKLIQFAKTKNKGNEVEEHLFKAYFTEGKDINDIAFLISIGEKIGLNEQETNDIFSNEAYALNVKKDIQEAREIGVTGVPFFVFDGKYAISGAQPVETFINALNKSYTEFANEGESCTPGGGCC